MSRNRFVVPDVVRLPLSEHDWIDVKTELNAGEERRVFSSQIKGMTLGAVTELNPEMVGMGQLVEYLVGWSFVDASGAPVPYTASAIPNLDVDTFNEIRLAVEAHDAAVEARRTERKKLMDGATSSPAISPSVV